MERESPAESCAFNSTPNAACTHLQSYRHINTDTHKLTQSHTYHMLKNMSNNHNFREKNFNAILFKEFMKCEQGYSASVKKTLSK